MESINIAEAVHVKNIAEAARSSHALQDVAAGNTRPFSNAWKRHFLSLENKQTPNKPSKTI